LDYPAEAERGDDKTGCSGYEDLAQAGAANVEKLYRRRARASGLTIEKSEEPIA
jgi:hypothetical protein